MFTWILIAIVIAFIFGVIKVEQVKNAAKKYGPQAREILNKAKTTVEEKASEIKKNIDAKKAQSATKNQSSEGSKISENVETVEASKSENTDNQ